MRTSRISSMCVHDYSFPKRRTLNIDYRCNDEENARKKLFASRSIFYLLESRRFRFSIERSVDGTIYRSREQSFGYFKISEKFPSILFHLVRTRRNLPAKKENLWNGNGKRARIGKVKRGWMDPGNWMNARRLKNWQRLLSPLLYIVSVRGKAESVSKVVEQLGG